MLNVYHREPKSTCVSQVNIIITPNSNQHFLANLLRKIPVNQYRNQRLKESKTLGFYNMDKIISKKTTTYLVPPLPLVEDTKEDKGTTEVIEFVLKQRAGSTATAPSYKL
jgi:hypothetical protein